MHKDNKYDEIDDNFLYADEKETDAGTDWAGIIKKLLAKKKLFIISFIVTILIAIPLVLTIPKNYVVQVKLAPEVSAVSGSSGGGLGSLMRSFGLGGTSSNSGDAILPTIYPDLMNSNTFLSSLFDIPVQTQDGLLKTTYYDYLLKHQKAPIWAKAKSALLRLLPSKKEVNTTTIKIGALTVPQTMVAYTIMEKVVCTIDENTGVILINVQDQDPVVCTIVADSTCQRLQKYITEYRMKKSRIELNNAKKQYVQAKVAYEAAKQKVESFNNSNWDLVDEDFMVQKQALQNDMQLKFTIMSGFNQQMLVARSKYESMRPVFTVLNKASVPILPAGPSRTKILLAIIILVLGIECVWVLYKDSVKEKIANLKNTPEE